MRLRNILVGASLALALGVGIFARGTPPASDITPLAVGTSTLVALTEGSAEPVLAKGDKLAMVVIYDGPAGAIYLGPMTTAEADTYVDAEPDVFYADSPEYDYALREMQLAELLATNYESAAAFRPTPATVPDLMKRANVFSQADFTYR